ncbi:protocadherin-20 [Lampris incognitus]|uniref:protocadherin-20 n=1 Tax=Lampris incognitus TaxID=2546036 RepID=UPI0024B5F136|nr:protocadherin-20 [Lampris incognitus]
MDHGTPDNMNWAGLLQNVLVMVNLRQITCGSVWFSIPEEQEAGVRVGSLGKDFSPPYQLLTQEYLWLDKNTGDLYTTEQKMDREELCPEETKAKECIIIHNAIVGPSADLIQFPVAIEDINDNAPLFENSDIFLNVSEDVAVGTSFLIDDQAQDKDTGSSRELQYHLQDSDGIFSLKVEKGPVIMLVVQTALDREIQDSYQMILVATDSGPNPLSATLNVTVKVTDVNDNCPRFVSESPACVIVPGDSYRDMVVAQVRAEDLDLGPNAAITYSLSPKVSERAKKLFSLDSHTGHIRLTQDLQSDSSEELVLKVLASGHHCPPADTWVTVSVLPMASKAPAIKIRFIAEHQNQTIVLPENQPPTVLALLELGGESDLKGMSLIIEGEVPFSLNTQNGKYLLSTSKSLDYEMKSEYHISVVVRRPSAEGFVTTRSLPAIKVRVLDVNDNYPHFLQSHYELQVEENNQPGMALLWMKASDADSGDNGRVTYRLGKHTSTIFRINSLTGQLSVSASLDREQQDMHTVTVSARDSGSPSLDSMTTVSIHIFDQNDNAPVFRTPHFIFFIPENVPPLAQVGRIGVTDPDVGENGNIEVHVIDSSGKFVIDNVQKSLRCTTSVDREMKDQYELQLLASDNGHPSPLTSTAKVTIFVEDVNDNQPKVILPNSNLSCLTVSPATTAGTMVMKIYAIDEDSGPNSDITYIIAAREPAHKHSPFRLDSRSGNITLVQHLLGEDLGMHHLFIVVSDKGKPAPLHTTVWVNLLVNETMEPCHLDSLPKSLPYRLAPPPSEAPICRTEGGPASYTQLILLVGLGMMLASICLSVITAVLYLKQKKRCLQQNKKGCAEDNEIPLRLKAKYYSDE